MALTRLMMDIDPRAFRTDDTFQIPIRPDCCLIYRYLHMLGPMVPLHQIPRSICSTSPLCKAFPCEFQEPKNRIYVRGSRSLLNRCTGMQNCGNEFHEQARSDHQRGVSITGTGKWSH